MTVVDFTFPQSGDSDYAENFGTWLGRSNITEYVEEGMSFTIDYGVPEVEISQGKAFVEIPESDTAAGDTRLSLDYAIIKESETISLSDNSTNHVYLTPNIGTNDSPTYDSYTSEANAAADALKIGEVDTSADEHSLDNRNPDSDFDSAGFGIALNIPVYDETSEASGSEGDVIWVTGSGSDDSGLYAYTGSEFELTGVDTLSDLNGVSGVTAILEGSNANRPSAGEEGRIYFNSSNNSVEYDDGNSWITLGVDPATIESNDLAFDPATQSELDTHAGDSDAHHSKTVSLSELDDTDVDDITVDLESNRPTAGSSGNLFIARDSGRVYYDNGSSWVSIGVSEHGQLSDISSDDHHTRYSNEEAQDAVGSILDGAFVYDDSGNEISLSNDSFSTSLGTHISGSSSVSLGGTLSLSIDDDFLLNSGDEVDGTLDTNTTNGRLVIPVGTDKYAT